MEKYEYKIVFLGESGTGAKTSLIYQFINNKCDPNIKSTLGASYVNIFIQINLGIIKLILLDTSGQNKYRAINKHFIKDSHCIILGYDITNKYSLNEIKNYHYNNAKNIVGDEALFYLVANKIDLVGEEEVSEKEAIDYSKEKSINYFRVSAYTGKGVNELFEDIKYSLIMKFKKKILDSKDKNTIREITKDGTEIKSLNLKRQIKLDGRKINRLKVKIS